VLLRTAAASVSVAVVAFRRGATDYVVKRNGFADSLTGRVRGLLEAA
jgi:hypothetical protein